MNTSSTPHPQHPHHLECPRCNCRTVVLQGDSRYVCLSCRWEQNLNQEGWDPLTTFLVTLLTIAFFLLILTPQQARSPQDAERDLGAEGTTGMVRAIASPRHGFDPLT